MDVFEAEAVIIGAGAVGLASGAALARRGIAPIVLEAADAIGTETSSRNSEVIHAGVHYTPGSLKARLCVEGRRALYGYCAARGIEARACGKLVVAVDDAEADALDHLFRRGIENGVEELALLSPRAAMALEPALSPDVRAAISSPTSGLFDSHAFMLALQGEIEAAGGAVVLATPAVSARRHAHGFEVEAGGAAPALMRTPRLINSAGHRSLDFARRIADGPHYPELAMHWNKGSYFTASGRAAFSRLIYPVNSKASTGLHLTIDLGGRTRLGPDAEWLADDAGPPFDYVVDPGREAGIRSAVARYWPGVLERTLSPDYSGVRPKIVGPGEPSADFLISGPPDHGLGGLVHLIGVESPGLTASLAIGEHVAALAAG